MSVSTASAANQVSRFALSRVLKDASMLAPAFIVYRNMSFADEVWTNIQSTRKLSRKIRRMYRGTVAEFIKLVYDERYFRFVKSAVLKIYMLIY